MKIIENHFKVPDKREEVIQPLQGSTSKTGGNCCMVD
jgi:hypothetical protein